MLFLLIKLILISLLISLLIIMLGFLFRVSGFSVQGFKVFPVGFRVFSYILKIVAFKLAQIPQKKTMDNFCGHRVSMLQGMCLSIGP